MLILLFEFCRIPIFSQNSQINVHSNVRLERLFFNNTLRLTFVLLLKWKFRKIHLKGLIRTSDDYQAITNPIVISIFYYLEILINHEKVHLSNNNRINKLIIIVNISYIVMIISNNNNSCLICLISVSDLDFTILNATVLIAVCAAV